MKILNEYKELQNCIDKVLLDIEAKSIGVAVSGGGDSLALLLAASTWAKDSKSLVKVATVDHKLRKYSGREAIFVQKICSKLSVSHDTLAWKKPEKIRNLQNSARLARLSLLTEWALEKGIKIILLGHSEDDQAETIMMNFIRGSGLEGLRGMPQTFNNDGIIFCRPFLSVKRHRLREFLRGHKINWIEDPSNFSDKYQRVKVRKVLPKLESLGLTADKLILMGERMVSASAFIRRVSTLELLSCIKVNSWGELELNRKKFLILDKEIQLRILSSIIGGMRGKKYRPRYKLIKGLLEKIYDFGGNLGVTVSGLKVSQNDFLVLFQREIAGIPGISNFSNLFMKQKIVPKQDCYRNEEFIWDERWVISLPADKSYQALKVGRIFNEATLKELRKKHYGMSYYTSAGLPAIYCEGRIIAVPDLVPSDIVTFSLLYSEQTFVKRLENGK